MSQIVQQLQLQLEPEPLSKWIVTIIEKGREQGYTDNKIKSWIRAWAKLRNYDGQQVSKILRTNGIRVYNRRPVIYQNYPKLVVCPKCVSIGKINIFYPYDKTAYVIRHEQIDGTWGRATKIRRCRRCYIYDKDNCAYIRQKLDFYEKRDTMDKQSLRNGAIPR